MLGAYHVLHASDGQLLAHGHEIIPVATWQAELAFLVD